MNNNKQWMISMRMLPLVCTQETLEQLRVKLTEADS